MRTLAAILFALIVCAPLTLAAQKQKREPLTDAQQEQIAEAGIDPVARVSLYVRFLNEHSDAIAGLIKRAHSAARSHRIDNELQDFSALMDELGDNLDVYSERKADIRKSLKGLNEASRVGKESCTTCPANPVFELSLKDALDSASDLADQAKQITADQEAYFKAHPDEKGQDRYEPK